MALLTATKQKNKNLTPQVDKESDPESDNDDKVYRIAVLAYYKAQARGYEPVMRCKTGWMQRLKLKGK